MDEWRIISLEHEKKVKLELEFTAGKCTRTKPKVGVNIHLIRHFRELLSRSIGLCVLMEHVKDNNNAKFYRW